MTHTGVAWKTLGSALSAWFTQQVARPAQVEKSSVRWANRAVRTIAARGRSDREGRVENARE